MTLGTFVLDIHENWLFSAIVVFMVVEEVFDLYLNMRQYRHLKKRVLPTALESLVDKQKFESSVDYSLDKLTFSSLAAVSPFLIKLVLYVTYFYPWLWTHSGIILENTLGYSSEYLQTIVFSGILFLGERLFFIPFELFQDFVIEERHGFNKKTLSIFFLDEIKSLLVSTCIGLPFLYVVIRVVYWGGKTFYFWLWGFTMLFSLAMLSIYPNVIAPLFNKFEDLQNAGLKEKIEHLAGQINYPLKRIYQMDASKRSAHSNAYLYGFGNNKRIVLFDTLLESSDENILAVVGHELGHWKYSHTIKSMIFSSLNLFVMFYLFGLVFFNPNIYTQFGFSKETGTPVVIGLFIFMNIFRPISIILCMVSTCLSRRYEFQADKFSAVDLKMNKSLQSALVELQIKNLSAFSVDPWYEWINYSHPHLVKRLEALDGYDRKDA